ncbi:hypothetical protein N7447_007759 [Penicillium robsamsonii]|uniref:uncharacterized protein n=1 Tax=Penicillium robsamsonii TaxID=1792511 RepID=UPI0025488F85|nr:uncharacterized protein N7447_007759 [Penicillium robsamsonii]KAJ5817751.1 hypothetical protein N7447_007759 [Penicillium robsamsonii]
MSGQLCHPLPTYLFLPYLHSSFRHLNHITIYPFNVPGTCHVYHSSHDLYVLPVSSLYFFAPSVYLHLSFRQIKEERKKEKEKEKHSIHPTIQHFNQPTIHLIVAGFTASGQSTDWSTTCVNDPCQSPTRTNQFQSDRGGLRVQDNRQAGYNHFDHPLPSPTSITHFQSDRGGLHGFRTIGRLVNQPSINYPLPSSTSINPRNNHFQSDRGELHSFRTIGRLVTFQITTPRIGQNYLNHPLQSTIQSHQTSTSNIHT